MTSVPQWNKGRATVERLLDEGRLQRVPPVDLSEDLLSVPRHHLKTAECALDDDLEGAYTLAYDAIRKAMVAYLNVQGLRPTRTGGHVVITECANAQLVPPLKELVNNFDRMRRNRNEVEYPPVGAEELTREEVEEDIVEAKKGLEDIAKLLPQLPVF
jgi:hypothetical protein